jgi:hypothetical protein
MDKKILAQGIPEQVYSEQIGAAYPVSINQQSDGKKVIPIYLTEGRNLFNPTSKTTEMQRTMTTIKASAVITAANQTALWTPATGKRIRIMGFSIVVNPATTTAAGSLVTLQRGTTDIDDVIYLGTAALAVPARWPGILPMNGLLLNPDEVLSANLTAACTAGGIYLNVWGCEE